MAGFRAPSVSKCFQMYEPEPWDKMGGVFPRQKVCGIFGILAHSKGESGELLNRAVQDLQHRGPDDCGIKVIDLGPGSGELGLAHTRLSIIDLSPLGHQPMHDPVTGNWIVFNGEIYNFRDLRRELEALDGEFRSQSDTEVILAAYRIWGQDFLPKLRGMFAFALWDAAQGHLLLARDPMGIKPLYYAKTAKGFAFASEVRTILHTGRVPRKLDPVGTLSYLAFGSVYEPWTIIEGISAVPPGHVLTVKGGNIRLREYWNPLNSAMGTSSDARRHQNGRAITRLPELLQDAVLSHLVSDVPVGIFLSGGIDSSSLVALLSRGGVRANTFSLVFREREFNEAPYSQAVAARFHTDHHEIPISHDDTLAALPDALRAMDQPTIDGINTYLVSAKARGTGMKVALTGLGADELFAGYSNFRRVPRMERLAGFSARLPGTAKRAIAKSVSAIAGKSIRGRKLAELAESKQSTVHPYFLARMLFGSSDGEALFVHPNYRDIAPELTINLEALVTESARLDPVNRVSYLESRCYMKNTLLRDSDFMSMAHGLELRVPFLDRALVETCFAIPGANKLNGRLPKSLLIRSLGIDLPIEIVKRPKRGFTLPFERWLRGEMKPVVEKTLLASDPGPDFLNASAVRGVWNRFLARETTWSRPWALYVLKQWCKLNL